MSLFSTKSSIKICSSNCNSLLSRENEYARLYICLCGLSKFFNNLGMKWYASNICQGKEEKYSFTNTYETVENDPELLQMLEKIGSEKDNVYLLLDQQMILIRIAENVVMMFSFLYSNPKVSGSTFKRHLENGINIGMISFRR